MLYCKDTVAIPFTHSPATYSKCGVPPLITAPKAIIASYFFVAATRCTTTGNSKAPGALTTLMSALFAPCLTKASMAPASNCSTIKLLKREATIQNLPPLTNKLPSNVFMADILSLYFINKNSYRNNLSKLCAMQRAQRPQDRNLTNLHTSYAYLILLICVHLNLTIFLIPCLSYANQRHPQY